LLEDFELAAVFSQATSGLIFRDRLEVRAELVLGRPPKALESAVQQNREYVLKEIVKRFLFEISKLLQ
jgi:hypothetical protein